MKKLTLLAVVFLLLSIKGMSQAPTSSDGKVGTAVNKAGNKTAQVAVSGASAIKDKKYDSKVGPAGQTIYINKNDHYYYVNGRGKKVYVAKAKLRDKQ
jgi:hypothetical protein